MWIKRAPGRGLGSFSVKSRRPAPKSRQTDKAWNPHLSTRGKPPGRPWHSPRQLKVCLLCLKQFKEEDLQQDLEEDEEQEEESDKEEVPQDPLSSDMDNIALSVLLNTKKSEESLKVPKRKRKNLYVRFLTLLTRHLKINTKRFKLSAVRNELEAPFCPECGDGVKHLCKMYQDLKEAKLWMNWRLLQISERIQASKQNIGGKLQQTLLKNLSTQLRVVGSYQVDLLRKQLKLKCGTSGKGDQVPRVSINKNSCLNAVKRNWKWKFQFNQMKQYLQSLIVVFALAVPPKEPPPPPSPPKEKKALIGPRSKVKRVTFGGDVLEAKKENVPPVKSERDVKVKREPGRDAEDGDDQDNDGGNDYSPPASPMGSPLGAGGDDNEDQEEEVDEGAKNGEDSDWSAGAASGNDSDADFSVNPKTERRWNLRRRCTRSKSNAGGDPDNDSDTDYIPGKLPPLRTPKSREDIPESEKPFTCNLCSQKFRMERSLKRHLSQAHAFLMQYTCPKCPTLRFRRKKDLDDHHRKLHSKFTGRPGEQLPYMGRPTPCTVCKEVFPSRIKMVIHRKTVHKIMATVHTCTICQKKIRGQFRLDFHMNTHNRPDKPHRCTKCPRAFRTEEGLKSHVKLHTDNPNWVPCSRIKSKVGTPNGGPTREGVFKCDIPGCDKIFYKNSNLLVHKSLHDAQFKCNLCSHNCFLPRDFRKHLMENHENPENKKYFCLHCDKSYTHDQTFDLHTKVAHPTKKMLICDADTCQEEFENTELLRQHLLEKHLPPEVEETKEHYKFADLYAVVGQIPGKGTAADAQAPAAAAPGTETQAPTDGAPGTDAQAPANPAEFSDLLVIPSESQVAPPKSEPTIPEDNEGPRLYTCARCNWSFTRKIVYSLHLILHTPRDNRRLYPCELCEKAFTVVDSLQTHYNRIHGPRIKPYLCLICGTRFHRKESFIPHMRIHKDKAAPDNNFKCSECDKQFDNSVNLKKHIRLAHLKEKFSRKCDKCEENFPTKLQLLQHKVDIHGEDKPYKCDYPDCDKGYFNWTQLREHKVVHSEPRFQCYMCPKRFKRRHNLEDHILVHKQEKNHFCEYCGKAFVKKSSLSLHLDIHRGIKKYKCDYCEKAFCRKYARDCHLRTHTKEKPYKCKHCDKAFGQYSGYVTHMKMHTRLNSDKVERVPFRKTKGVGKPIEKEKVPSSAEVLHEAMKAAFEDITGELEVIGEVIGEGGALNAVQALQEVEPKEEQEEEEEKEEMEEQEEESEEEEEKPKRKRKPKKYKKEYSCGFCGKVMIRVDFYNKHVAKHMKEGDSLLEGGREVPRMEVEGENSLKEVLKDEEEEREVNTRRRSREFTTLNVSALSMPSLEAHQPVQVPVSQPQAYHPLPVLQPEVPPPPPPQVQAPAKKRGRPPKPPKVVEPPGSRLARIVEDVLESAIGNRPKPPPVQYPQQHQQSHSPHVAQTQSPHQHQLVHTPSPHSTPSGSPAPNNQVQQTQQQQQGLGTLNFPGGSSILSPFLFQNPYLIPRLPDTTITQQQQQDPMLASFSHNRQQSQQHQSGQGQQYTGHHALLHPTPITTGSSVISGSSAQQIYSQQQQQLQFQHQNRSTLPQDLSKTNYSMFYNNQQQHR